MNTEKSNIEILKKAIQKSIDSGRANDFDAKTHLASLKTKKNRKRLKKQFVKLV